MWWLLEILLIFTQISNGIFQVTFYEKPEDDVLQIAGIFNSGSNTQKLAFNESVLNVKFEPIIIEPDSADSFTTWKALCSDNAIRPIVIFGPQNPITDGAVRDQCAVANIPHIQASWQPFDPVLELNDEEEIPEVEPTKETEEETNVNKTKFRNISINFYPDSNDISIAYARLLKYYNWKNFAVLYEDDFGLLRIQKILAEYTAHSTISVFKLDPEKDNRNVFKQLKQILENRFLLDCHVDRIAKYMSEAQALQIVNAYQHYILLNMDAMTKVTELTKLESNITWLSLTDTDMLKDTKHFLALRVGSWKKPQVFFAPPVYNFQTEALIMDDVVNHIRKAVRDVITSNPTNPPCEGEPWEQGALLQEAILKANITGVTGNVQFDENGRRINYMLHVNEIYSKKLQTIGTWNSSDGDNIVQDQLASENQNSLLSNKKFIVMSRKAEPYFFEKPPCTKEDCPEDDMKYEGFSVDLVDAIFTILRENMKLNYTYEFVYYENTNYGSIDPKTKKWDGLIGYLLEQKADLAVCDLTITEKRKTVVDFSVPFMSLGISILYTQDVKVPPSTFSFLNPYSFEVWMYTATAYCVVSIILFVCSRISPADWENPQPCEKDPEELENIWNFKNCTWLTMGSIMTQGCDILPKAIGSRWVCGMWWFFAMIVCQTYIAQLAASMTEAEELEPIKSVEDLAKQSKIRYGALDRGSTLDFFKNSKDPMFQKIYENMAKNPALLVNSNDEGQQRVLNSHNKYAFFMESCTIEYKLKRNCDLKKIGGELDSKDYGIAMPPNSPYRSHINGAILQLKESTRLDNIRAKWWNEMNGAKECEKPVDTSDVEDDLEMENLIGAFIVLIVGLVFCLFITAAEFLNEVRNIVVREQVPFKEAFITELKASLNFCQLQKPVLKNPSRAGSRASSADEDRETKHAAAIENFLDLEKEFQ
nr:ionotropic glutamate receptor 7 [Achelura yunnanensis]